MTDHSKRDWKYGEVALWDYGDRSGSEIVLFTSHGWFGERGKVSDQYAKTFLLKQVRPLALIDPENDGAIKRLCAAYYSKQPQDAAVRIDLREHMANALREFIAPEPPRIPEPGVYGIVRASCVHSRGERLEWVRDPDGNWRCIGPGYTSDNPDDWDSLVDPILVRPGIND